MKRNYLMSLASVAMCLLTTTAFADDSVKVSTDPSGTFFWTQDFGAGEADHWLILDADGDKLTGSYSSNDESVPILDGKIEDGKFSFKIELEVDGSSITTQTKGGNKTKHPEFISLSPSRSISKRAFIESKGLIRTGFKITVVTKKEISCQAKHAA